MSKQRWKILIEYDGTDYAGWQRQANAPSIQQDIEEALFRFCGQEICIYAAGRTDAGVHALGQVAHFDLDYGERDLRADALSKALTALLRPRKIAVLEAERVAADFHARFHALKKIYRYKILNRKTLPVLERDYLWHIYTKLDVEAMQKAAHYLIGTHDFTSFRAQECQAKSPVRSLDRAEILKTNKDEIHFIFEGKSFLHHQVRNMVGSLVNVGKGKWQPEIIQDILVAKERSKAGMTAPPQGLFLEKIFY